MMDRLEFKFAPDDMDVKTGEFSGYASVFGIIDSHGDVIDRGAFQQTLADWERKGSLPPMKLMHGTSINPFAGSDIPIGKWQSMREDERGLHVKGKLSGLETDRGRFHYALMQDGALNAMSIGYRATKQSRGSGEVKRRLHSVKLMEVSLLPEGSNDQAIITDLKGWPTGAFPTVRQFEEFLRDAGGFSKSVAAAIASTAAPHLRGDPEAEGDPMEALWAAMRGAPIIDLTGE